VLLIVEAGPILGVDFLLPMYAISSMITLKALDIGARSFLHLDYLHEVLKKNLPWPWLTCTSGPLGLILLMPDPPLSTDNQQLRRDTIQF